jgi:hypothetical protein
MRGERGYSASRGDGASPAHGLIVHVENAKNSLQQTCEKATWHARSVTPQPEFLRKYFKQKTLINGRK